MHARIVEYVFAQRWPESKPTHPDDIAHLREGIARDVAFTMAYLDDHAEHQRWVDEGQRSQPAE